MEIKFNNLSYEEDNLNNINMNIDNGSIVGIINDNLDCVGKLISGIKRPSSGELLLDNISIKRSNHVDGIERIKDRVAYLSSNNDIIFLNDTVKDEIKDYIDNYGNSKKSIIKHIMDSLKLVGLDDSYLTRNPNEMSYVEKKKVLLACLLSYNPEVLVLCDFEKGLLFKDREYFKKLFLKLKKDFKKTIIIISNDLRFMFNLIDKYYVIDNGNVVLEDSNFYNEELYNYIDIPKIVEFTMYCNSKGYKINEYVDIKELIKELYRVIK